MRAQSRQHACFLTSPGWTSSYSLQGSYLTTGSLLESTFTTPHRGSSSSLLLSWLPSLSLNTDLELP